MALFGKKNENSNVAVSPENENKFSIKRRDLKNKAFQSPDDLCKFVNENEISIVSINTTDRMHIIYYYG
ncbi:hypothetical protein BZG01_00160 [Labilibaculum manganireducens]|uniref:Uncharacterized protein n=1 Tax=Labilibaculum manganireducens TaxID=1940525 RepID=A0A2N3IGE4_9BACT|nr:hypothetical protein [Labilibaculum manganireducens]PKQ69386.1 hypothetical protein BZG01_00160 [Labilibaculum manganireducens]